MIERELKLHVPMAARLAVEHEMRLQGATETLLRACYFDTPGHDLARAKVALRLRLEGAHWVQTLKTPGADALTRIEINHPRPDPTLDLSVYKGMGVAAVFDGLKSPLAQRYETRVMRLGLKVHTASAIVELVYDRGMVCANGLELPIHEVEFELVSGDSRALFELGEQWMGRHGLVLDLRSKAERGNLLARLAEKNGPAGASAMSPSTKTAALSTGSLATNELAQLFKPRRAADVRLESGMTLQEAYLACAYECLEHIVRNATLIAAVDTAAIDTAAVNTSEIGSSRAASAAGIAANNISSADKADNSDSSDNATTAVQIEYVHQLRVGIRRLRSCWKLFNQWIALGAVRDPPSRPLPRCASSEGRPGGHSLRPRCGIEPATIEALRKSFGLFGQTRDDDVVRHGVAPQLERAGMPPCTLVPAAADDVGQAAMIAAGADFQMVLLKILGSLIALGDLAEKANDHSSTNKPPMRKSSMRPSASSALENTKTASLPLKRALRKRLDKWLNAITTQGIRFAQLPVHEQHELRKKVKRLRYGLDFSEELLATSGVARLRKALAHTQEALGELNDFYVAQHYYEELLPSQPQALFALGRLAATQTQKKAEAELAFKDLAAIAQGKDDPFKD